MSIASSANVTVTNLTTSSAIRYGAIRHLPRQQTHYPDGLRWKAHFGNIVIEGAVSFDWRRGSHHGPRRQP